MMARSEEICLGTGQMNGSVTYCCHLHHTRLQLWWCTGTQLLQLQHWKAAALLTALLEVLWDIAQSCSPGLVCLFTH
jgi:hypothetical protein